MDKKQLLKELYRVGVEAVMPKNFIPLNISLEDNILKIANLNYNLEEYENIYVIGSGKASIDMALELKEILKDRVKKYLVVSNYQKSVEGIKIIQSSHPIISQKSIKAAEDIIDEFTMMSERDLSIYLLSGGTSALIEKPVDGVSLDELSELGKMLLESGMDISKMNVIRKSLSKIKGGGLLEYAKCDGVVLVLSDVIGDDLDTIGSAPLFAKPNDISAIKILKEFHLWDRVTDGIKEALLKDNPKNPKRSFPHIIMASNSHALQMIDRYAKELNINSKIVTNSLNGDVKDVAKKITKSVSDLEYDLLLFGGESTVKVAGVGKGGRNQELCLWVLKQMREDLNFYFLSAGSDGIDGNSDAAGGVVGIDDLDESIDEYLKNNDSYHYLLKHNSLVKTGDSGTNVMDIMIALKE
ncbi:MAG: glycerate dehydrogenase [Sulfurospirillum sp.]|nr:MAG: glycerate dehydrogenase [Sulfurospirillum sp.]